MGVKQCPWTLAVASTDKDRYRPTLKLTSEPLKMLLDTNRAVYHTITAYLLKGLYSVLEAACRSCLVEKSYEYLLQKSLYLVLISTTG